MSTRFREDAEGWPYRESGSLFQRAPEPEREGEPDEVAADSVLAGTVASPEDEPPADEITDDPVAVVSDRPADEVLVRERPVHVRGVEEGDPELERAVDRRDRLAFIGGAVELGHPHAAQSERGHVEPLRAQPARLHGLTISPASIGSCPSRHPSSTSSI